MASLPKGILRVLTWFDSTADELKALVNDDGRVPISIDEQNQDLNAQLLVYDSSAWVKSPIIWGFTGRLAISHREQKSGAGQYTKVIFTVPSGYVYVVTYIMAINETTICGQTTFSVVAGAYEIFIYQNTPVAAWELLGEQVDLRLEEGDYLKVYMNTCLNNDWIRVGALGYIMKVDM